MPKILNHGAATVAGVTLLVFFSVTAGVGAQETATGKMQLDEIAGLSLYLQEAAKKGGSQIRKGESLVEKGRSRVEDGNEQIEDGKALVRKGDKNVAEIRERYQALAGAAGSAGDPAELADEAKRFKKVASDWEGALETIEDGQELIEKGNAAINKGNQEILDGNELIALGNKILRDVREASAEPSATEPLAQ